MHGTAGDRGAGGPVRWRWIYLAPAAIALVLRWVHVSETHNVPLLRHLVGDAAGYWSWAQSILGGDWLGAQGFYQAPLYPYCLAALFGVGVDEVQAVRCVQAAIGAVSVLLLTLGTARLFEPRSGVVCGVLSAAYAPAIFYDGLIQKASLGCILVCSLVLLINVRPVSRWWIATGVVLGLLVLTRENAMVWIPVVALWVLFGFRRRLWAPHGRGNRGIDDGLAGQVRADVPEDGAKRDHTVDKSDACGALDRRSVSSWRERVIGLALLLGGLGAMLLPVAVRNAHVCGAWSISTFQAGPNFYIGNRFGASGRYAPLVPGHETPQFERTDATRLAEASAGERMSPREVSRYWMSKSLDEIRSEPWAWFRLMARKWMMVWSAYEVSDVESQGVYAEESVVLRWLGHVWHFGVLAPLAALGVVLTRGRWRELWVYYGLIASMAASVALFYIMGRYRFPLVPLLMPFAAAGLVGVWDGVRAMRVRKLGGAVTVALGVAIVANLEIHPEERLDAAAFMNAGSALAMSGEFERAEVWLRRAVETWPESATANANYAQLLATQDRYRDALPFYLRAFDVEPALPNLAYNYAVTLERLDRGDEALALYRRAVELDAGDKEARAAVLRLTNHP